MAFSRFSERARRALTYAQRAAQEFQHNYIGTEHILLGVLQDEESTAAKVIAKLELRTATVRGSVRSILGRGSRAVRGNIVLTPRAKRAIELAVAEARELDDAYVGTEHLLVGLIREGEGIAAGVFASYGVDAERARLATQEVRRP